MNTQLVMAFALLFGATIALWCAIHIIKNTGKKKDIEQEETIIEKREVD